ncbi:MAG TPA: hydrogenase/urease maturation nickel metallochaperone HypA [Candidatus Omnitrophota bacterium]|nr:hydrogenase/urease maturation nickel metallochaperone HypA [Candidatus Omnitrophota bacterium]HPD84912.1 hydrogenase/urease maturation nickel metallochaperone HypA [Candidatus Omnitrophota bacterium]HRZ03770.1 hydrogenase/urease maturation nickel metallochaperone HypA [Candidatus Omnitrophota bacterium]
MHETHMIQPIIDGITEHAKKEGAKKVTKVVVKVGQYTGVMEGSFKETFSILAKGTMLEGAKIEVVMFPGWRVELVSFDVE